MHYSLPRDCKWYC